MTDLGYRQFWLENENGERLGLNGEHEFILVNPTGLGWTSGIQYANLKHGFFTPSTEDTPEQQSVVGDLVFHGEDPYTQYRFFADWVIKAKTLYLLYMPRTTVYRRRVVLNYLTKTELTKQGALAVPIAIQGVTPWYIPRSGVDFYPVEDLGYAFVMEESLLDKAEGDNNGRFGADPIFSHTLTVTPTGHIPASFAVTCEGPVSNPVVFVYSKKGELVGKCAVKYSLTGGERFEYSSSMGDSYVRATDIYRNRARSLLDYVDDLSVEIYPKLTPGETYRIAFNSESNIYNNMVITVQDYMNSV